MGCRPYRDNMYCMRLVGQYGAVYVRLKGTFPMTYGWLRLGMDLPVSISARYVPTNRSLFYIGLLTVAVLGGFLYVAGGEVTNDQRSPLNTAFRFDPRTHSWLQIASMNHRRESFQLGVLNGMLYAVGRYFTPVDVITSIRYYAHFWTAVRLMATLYDNNANV